MVCRRRLAAVLACAFLLPTAAAAASGRSWAQPQIKLVTSAGIFPASATFDPDSLLDQATLAQAIAALTATPAPAPGNPVAPVSVEQLDRSLVDALGLHDAASRFYAAAANAGLAPPRRFGSEVVARLLGLRLNHPAGQDALELQPQQTATVAEAAYSLAQILRFAPSADGTSRQVEQAQQESLSFVLPPLDDWQRQIVSTAFSYVGYPYVWGGVGAPSAGFDCSGFVLAVYKLTPYANEGALASVLRGRTTMQLSAEVPRTERIGVDDLQPGDVMFFGRGVRSKPAQVSHAAIYLGNGWLVQSSDYGVALAPFDGWYRSSFAWARRPLAEAGLS